MASSISSSIALAALLMVAAAAAAAEASIFRKTITTVEEMVDANDGEMEQCREEMRRHQLGSCRAYMQYGRSDLLRTAAGNPEVPRQCCNEMGRMREECRCFKLEEMAREMMQEGAREMRKEEMMSRAQNLPAMCGMGPQRCRIRLVSY